MIVPQFLPKLAINARFLVRPPSGVDRVAIEIIRALAQSPNISGLILLHPTGAKLFCDWIDALPDEARQKVSLHPIGRLSGHLWEQLELPWALRELSLLSLCSTGPVIRRNHAVMIHDAQVWDTPHSYSRAFRLAYRLLLPVLGRTARHVLTVSQFSAGRLVAVGIAPKGKPRVVPNGAEHILRTPPDPNILHRHGLATGGYILAIGNLAPHKNLRRLVEAAANRSLGSPPLVVAGGKNARVFADAGLPEAACVLYIGRVTDSELRALYAGAMALAFPSLTEGFGLPPVEAMLCGCPVIATTKGAVPEVCGDAVLYVDPADTLAWTAALDRIARDAALRADLRAKGKARAARYTWAKSAAALLEQVR